MNLSEKFVTELSLYDPDGSGEPLQSPVILLGVFLATDQVLGDHSVYKVSPVSPLEALKIRWVRVVMMVVVQGGGRKG